MAGYRGQVASAWAPNVKAPDLSNVYKKARQIGRNSVLDDFYAAQTKAIKDSWKSDADAVKTERAHAAAELGNEPESESFWDRLGQAAGEGLQRTFDVLSRFNYAGAGVADYLYDQDREPSKDEGPDIMGNIVGGRFLNAIGDAVGLDGGLLAKDSWGFLDDLSFKDIPNVAEEWWEGFSGKDKKYFGSVIKENAERDTRSNRYDSKAYQGIAGFGADVILDPTTYIGVGLVTKPFKKAAEKAVDNAVIDDLVGLGLTKTVGDKKIPISADDYHTMFNTKRTPNTVPANWSEMSRKTRRRWMREHTVKGMGKFRRSEDVARTNLKIQNLDKVYKALKESPDVSEDAVKAVQKMLDETNAQLGKAARDYGSRAYRAALKEFDKTKALDELQAIRAGDSLAESWDNVATVDTIRTGLQAHRYMSKGNPKYAEYNQRMFDKNMGFLKSNKLSDRFKSSWEDLLKTEQFRGTYDEASGTMRRSEYGRLEDDIKWHYGEINRRKKELEGITPGTQTHKLAQSKLSGYEKTLNELYEKRDIAQAKVMHRLIAQDANRLALSKDPKYASRYFDVTERLAYVSDNIKRLEEMNIAHSSVVPSTKRNKKAGLEGETVGAKGTTDQVDDSGVDELRDLKQEQRELLDELDGMEGAWARENPDAAFWNSRINDAPTLKVPTEKSTPEEVELFKEARLVYWEQRVQEIFDQKVATEGRKLRADTGKLKGETLAYTGYKGDDTLRIMDKDGTWLDLTTKEGRDKIAAMATVADKRKFHAKKNQPTTKDANGVVTGHQTPLSAIVFNRLFEKQHQISVVGARAALAEHKGNVVTVKFMGAKEEKAYTREGFLAAIKENPAKFARAGLGIPIPRHMLPKSNKLGGKKEVSFTQWKEYATTTLGMSYKEAQSHWDDSFADFVNNYDKASDIIKRNWAWNLKKQKAQRKHKIDSNIDNPPLGYKRREELMDEAQEEAKREIDKMDAIPNLTGKGIGHNFGDEASEMTLKERHEALLKDRRHAYAEKIRQEKLANPSGRSKPAQLTAKVNQLKDELAKEEALMAEALKEAERAQKAMKKRLEEQIDLDVLEDALREGQAYLRVKLGGIKLADVPVPEALVTGLEKMATLPVIRTAYQAWYNAFKPASTLEPEMNLARLRMQSHVPKIIESHLTKIKQDFSGYKPADRNHALKLLREGKSPVGEIDGKLHAWLKDYTKYTQGRYPVGDEVLEVSDLNAFLPDPFKFIHPKGGRVNDLPVGNVKGLLTYMRNMPKDADPMKLMWSLSIAAEQAIAHKAMQHTIKTTFGLKRILDPTDQTQNVSKMIEQMHKKHGYVTNRNIGKDYYFPPDVSADIDKLFWMTKPQNQEDILRLYDKAMRAWKATVTVYNPGYYTRNGIGETFMNVFDNVMDPRHYNRAARILFAKMPDETIESIKKLESWKKHATQAQMGAKVGATLPGGAKLTYDDIWVLYNDVGLKSGFISTEFDHLFPAGNTLRSTGAGQVATKINDKVRSVGEKYEDYFRLTHFISRLERSTIKVPGHLKPERRNQYILQAAEEAAEYVRKYHFDYTDFTRFEKSTMLRLFPFYKWTRKAMPLMAGMLFTQPGKVMLYPKAMTGVSVAAGGQDPMNDPNGFYPNYDGVVPEWMQALVSYPVGQSMWGTDSQEDVFMNIANPPMDVYKMFQNPASAVTGMLSPAIKMPMEQLVMGRTMDPAFDIEFDKVEGSRQDNLARVTPITSLLDKMHEGKDTAHTWWSFGTGLGFYENSEERKKGEEFRRNIEKSK